VKNEDFEPCKTFLDLKGNVVSWVGENLGEDKDWIGQNITLGIEKNAKLLGGVVFHNIRPKIDVWLTIYTTDKKWCNKRTLRAIFDIAFNFLESRRVSVRVDALNKKSRKLVEGLGFQKEGVLRFYEDNGNDSVVYSMLKNECIWRTKENE